jgi:hypothetical protein
MQRKLPSHITKYYEALWCIGDSRLKLGSIQWDIISAQVTSSDRSKQYDVSYDTKNHAIMSNDNSSYRKGELWYPSLALLLFLDVIDYQSDYGEALSGIEWKKINTLNNNNFDLTQQQVEKELIWQGMDITSLRLYCDRLSKSLEVLQIEMFGETKLPPK